MLSSASLGELQEVGLQAAAAGSILQGALQRLHRLGEQLQGSSSVVENASSAARETNQLTAHTQATGQSPPSTAAPATRMALTLPVPVGSANQAQLKLGEVERRTERLMEQVQPLSMLGETLNRNLSEIRELIQQARRQAASVRAHTHTHIHTGATPTPRVRV